MVKTTTEMRRLTYQNLIFHCTHEEECFLSLHNSADTLLLFMCVMKKKSIFCIFVAVLTNYVVDLTIPSIYMHVIELVYPVALKK